MADKLARAQHIRASGAADKSGAPAASAKAQDLGAQKNGMSEGASSARIPSIGKAPSEAVSFTKSQATGGAQPAHARPPEPQPTSQLSVGGRHAGLDRTAIAAAVAEKVMPRPKPPDTSTTAKRIEALRGSVAPGETGALYIGGGHAGIDRTVAPPVCDPGTTGALYIGGNHAGIDRTVMPAMSDADAALNALYTDTEAETLPSSRKNNDASSCASSSLSEAGDTLETSADNPTAVGGSAALISICVMISRITGFARTWVMAFALGSTMLASSYNVANTVPNMLFEFFAGGILVTAFLPVYVSVKKKLGQQAGNEYASNLFTLVILLLGAISVLCIAFPSVVIFTQSFYTDQSQMTDAVFLFQFFAIQIVFYGASVILSGLLNANRDYLWSSLAPVANNVIVIATFILYAAIAPQNPEAALYIIAIGNPAGVLVQVLIQMPALKKNGIRLRPRINFRDPALRETLSLGVPAILVMLCSTVVVSVQTAAAYGFADNGPSVLAYARLWFTLPYAFLSIPITTAMFTELASMQAEGNSEGVKRGIVSGTNQILFFMIPFAMYLVVFSLPLVTLYHAGAFTMDNVSTIASYLAILALALPVYGVNTYLQKIFSSLRKMGIFALFNFVAGVVQITVTMYGAAHMDRLPLEVIAVAEVLFYVVADICLFIYLRRHLGAFGLRSIAKACLSGVVFGGLGAAAGGGVLWALTSFVAPLSGSIPQALAYVVAGGVVALVVTFGLSMKLHVPEAAFIQALTSKVTHKLGRRQS